MTLSVADIAHCLGGIVPPALVTVDADGEPNIVRLSSVRAIDDRHLALTRQFFGKTVTNLAVNPRAVIGVVDPATYDPYLADLLFLRSETSGPLFARLSAEVDAIASIMGMSDVFKLKGADVYEVLEIHAAHSGRPG